MKSQKEIKSHQSKQPDLCLKQNLRYLAIEIGSRLQKRSFFPATSYKMLQVTILLASTCRSPGVWQKLLCPCCNFKVAEASTVKAAWSQPQPSPALEASCDSEPAVSLMEAVSIRFMYPCQAKGSSNWSSEKMWKVCVQPRKVARNMTMSLFRNQVNVGFVMRCRLEMVLVLSWWSTLQAHRFTITSTHDWSTRPNIIPHFWQNYFGTNKSWILNLYNQV